MVKLTLETHFGRRLYTFNHLSTLKSVILLGKLIFLVRVNSSTVLSDSEAWEAYPFAAPFRLVVCSGTGFKGYTVSPIAFRAACCDSKVAAVVAAYTAVRYLA